MEAIIYKKNNEGFITVFLSLVLILILSLIMTIIEGARFTTAKVFAERALTTAMDSVLADYYRPLFDEYHILGLEAGYGSGGVKSDEISDKLNEYMTYTFQPGQNLPDLSSRMEFYDTSVDSLQVTDYTRLMDYDGEIFINQGVEYMKYKELGKGLEFLLDKLSMLEEPKKVTYLYEEKLKVEEELVRIDEGLLTLMRLLDGISTDKKGIKTNKDGSLKTMSDFIKKICIGVATKERVGIYNDSIYQALQANYVDPSSSFNSLKYAYDCLEDAIRQLGSLEQEHDNIIENINKAEEALEELNKNLSQAKAGKEDTEQIEEQIDDCKKGISNLQESIKEVGEQILYYNQKKQEALEDIYYAISYLRTLLTPMTPLILEAITAIDGVLEASAKADPLIGNYEAILREQGKDMSKDIYENLEEGLKDLKRYQMGNNQGYDFLSMMDVLRENISIITMVEGYLTEAELGLGQENYQYARDFLTKAETFLAGYQIDGLSLDYSSLVIRKEEDIDPLDSIRSLMEEGLVGLVIDTDTLSQAEISEEHLPSILYALSTSEEVEFDMYSFFENLVIGGNGSGVGGLFQSFGNFNVSSFFNEGVNQAGEHVLFWAYLQEHFNAYTSKEEELLARKPSILHYEQEYLLVGKNSDRENLTSIISKIILLRTLLNFTSVLGDRAKWSESKALATALVGFTGLPILVSITQTIIMVLLAFSEALVDTSALLMGKEVALRKNQIKYNTYELINLNRGYIKAKADSYPDKDKGVSLSYSNYLSVFLLIQNKKTLSYRSMDLIQENIQLRYEDSFYFSNCLFGFDTKVSFITKQKFISLPYIQEHIKNNKDFNYSVQASYSY